VSFPVAIFDVDGTLVDSRAIITTCMDAAFVDAGFPAPGYEKTRRIIGLSLGAGLNQLLPEATDEDLAHLLDSYRTIFLRTRSDPAMASPLYDGVSELLAGLVADGWRLGIATGKSRRGLDVMMDQFGWRDVFDCSFCADDGPGKPHPYMVLENLRALGACADQAVVIGDSEHDVAMAVAAGTRAIGVTWGFGTRAEMAAAGAHEIIDTITTLRLALGQFGSTKRLV
jgi:phosphoglycolate phosphatase